MNKVDFVSYVAKTLRDDGFKKPVKIPSAKFTIESSEGDKAEFEVGRRDKDVIYTVDDVKVILDAFITCIIELLKNGESINIKGLGSFRVNRRKAQIVKSGFLRDDFIVDEHNVFKFVPGENIKIAIKLLNLNEREKRLKESKEEVR